MRKIRKSRGLLFTTLMIVFLLCRPITAFADTGPKPQITVKVTNSPDELYYLDLVEEDYQPGDEASSEQDNSLYQNIDEEDKKSLDPEMLQALIDAVPENWHACLTEGTYAPMWGSLTGQKQSDGTYLHTFDYVGVPEDYRILIVTKSGKELLTDTLHRDVLQTTVTLDWSTQKVTTPSVTRAYVLQFLATFLPTVVIEGIVLLLFRYSFRKNWKVFLFTNLVTQGGLSVYFAIDAVKNGLSWWYYPRFTMIEIVIMIVECIIYSFWLKGYTKRRAVVYGITANLCSVVLGFILARPVWEFVSSIT